MEKRRPQARQAWIAALSLGVALALGGTAAAASPPAPVAGPPVNLQLLYEPNDPAFSSPDPNAPGNDVGQWNLVREGLMRAWDYGRGSGAVVAVIDTGLDGNHPDLSGRVAWAVDRDDDHSTPATYDDVGHGTHVSGLICGAGGNGYGIAGAGFGCRLGVEKTDLTDESVAIAIDDAANLGADVINLSIGAIDTTRNSPEIQAAINRAWRGDVVIVAAAQNVHVSGDQGYPAKYLQPPGTGPSLGSYASQSAPDCGVHACGLVVTGAYHGGQNADTGYGDGISMAAYGFSTSGGRGIFSTYPANQTEFDTGTAENCATPVICIPASAPCNCRANFGGDNRFAYLQGTSMAAAQVSGAAALIRAYRPKLSAPEVITALKRQASGNGVWSPDLGWGILNAGAALKSVAPANCVVDWKSKHRKRHARARRAATRRHRSWHRRHPLATPAQHAAWHRRDARNRRASNRRWHRKHKRC
jgi:subtilisin family serine protease